MSKRLARYGQALMVIPETEVVALLDGREIYRAVHPPGDYVIGRDSDVAIRLPSVQVSRRHAQLSLNYFDWSIEDFGSANGTLLGKDRVRELSPIFPNRKSGSAMSSSTCAASR